MAKKREAINSVLLQLRVSDRLAKFTVDSNGSVNRYIDDANNILNNVVSYTNDDYYLKVDSELNDKKALLLLDQKLNATLDSRLINHSKTGHVYATAPLIDDALGIDKQTNVFPLIQLLNIASKSKTEATDVNCFMLGDKNELLILTGKNEDGDAVLSLSTDVDDVLSQINTFALSSKVKADFTYSIYDNADFFVFLNEAISYPNSKKLLGLEASILWSGLIGLSFVGLTAVALTWFYQSNKISSITSEIAEISTLVTKQNEDAALLISNHIPDVIEKSSISHSLFFKNAESLWINDSYLNSEVTKDAEKHVIHLPIDETSFTSNQTVSSIYKIKPPENCILDNISTGATLNEVTATYNCKDNNSNFSIFGF